MPEIIDGVTYYVVRFLNEQATDVWGRAYVEYGGDATSQAPVPKTYPGKIFTGWNRDITYITADKTVRAVYATACTVTFRNYADDGDLSVQVIAQGTDAAPPTPEEIPDMRFTGWDADYANVQTDLTIHPLYETTLLTVRFLNYAGTDVLSVQYLHKGDSAIAPAPERIAGFIFLGWSAPFTNVKQDLTVRPLYSEIPDKPVLKFYSVSSDGSSGTFLKSYDAVNACTITQKLSGECTIDFTLMTRQMEGYVSVGDRLEVEGLVFTITEIHKQISGGVCYTRMAGEHVSYILNDAAYLVSAYDSRATVTAQLQTLLSGTPFTVGTIDFENTVSVRVNREATRRSVIMQLISLVGGEIEYYGYTIGIRSHLGKETPTDIMSTSSVEDISYAHNASEDNTNYSLSLYRKGDLELGDELRLDFAPLHIHTDSRIVGMDWNPFNYREVSITVGNYIPTLNDSLYDLISTIEDITQKTAKYTIEFGEIIGNGTFYFTRSYQDRPYWQVQCNDHSNPVITLLRKDGSEFNPYIGATLSGVSSETTTLVVFYLTIPIDESRRTEGDSDE